jgi:glycosyltransferase involved in cell wall biosynthesis
MCCVSIIVPLYNVEKYLRECVDSLINQTLHDIEIVLVDDGSTDSSGKICDEYALADSRVRVIHKANGGQASARNIGMDSCRGEYVLFVDSDDWILENTCEILYKNAIDDDCDIVVGDLYNEEKIIRSNPKFRRIPDENNVIDCRTFLKQITKSNVYDIVPVLKLVKRSYLIENKLYYPTGLYYEDHEYSLKLLVAQDGKGHVKKIRFPFYYYREREQSTTTEVTVRKVSDLFKIYKRMVDYVNSYPTDDAEYYEAMKKIVMICFYHLGRFFSRLESREEKRQILKEISADKHYLSEALKWPALDYKEKIQNTLFIISPMLTSRLIRKWEGR